MRVRAVAPAQDGLRFSSGPGRWVLLATVLGSAVASIDATVVGIALPAIGQDFGAGLAVLQWIVTAYTLMLAGLLLPAGAPMLPLTLFSSRQFTAANVVTFVVYGAIGGALFLLPIQLQQVSGYTALAAGISLLPVTAIMLALSSRSGAFASRIGPWLQMSAGPVLIGAGLALFTRITASGGYRTQVLPAIGGITGDAYRHPALFSSGFHTASLTAAALCGAAGLLATVTIRNPARPGAAVNRHERDVTCALDAPPAAR